MWLWWLLVACPRPDREPRSCDGLANDPCGGLTCIDVCGSFLASGPGPSVVGWEVVDLPHPAARQVTRIGGVAVSVDGTAVRTFAGDDLALLGMLGPLDRPYAIAPAGDGVIVGLFEQVLVAVSLADPANPTATGTWHPAPRPGESDNVGLVGTWRGRALLTVGPEDPRVAVVDFSDPGAPVVEACLRDAGSAGGRLVRSTDAFVAVGEVDVGGAVSLFDPSVAETPFARLPADWTFAVEDDRIVVWEHDDEAVLYEVADGAVTELGRRQGDHLRAIFDPSVAAGVVLHGGVSGGDYLWGLDLRDATLPLVGLDPGIGAGIACPLRILDGDGSRLFDVAFPWHASERFPPDTAPACPGVDPAPDETRGGGVSPDGEAILVKDGHDPTWWAYRPGDGSRTASPVPTWAGEVAWMEGAFSYKVSSCFEAPGLHVLPEDGSGDVHVDLPGWPAVWAVGGDEVWVLSEAGGVWCNVEFEDGDPARRTAWRVDAQGAASPFALPDGSQPRGLFPVGDEVALVDHAGDHRLLSRDGAVTAEMRGVPMPMYARFAASALGVFTEDQQRGVWWSRPDEDATQVNAGCEGVFLVGAEGPYVRWNRQVRPAAGYASYMATELVDPETGEVVASLPAPTWGERVIGSPGALVGNGVFVVSGP